MGLASNKKKSLRDVLRMRAKERNGVKAREFDSIRIVLVQFGLSGKSGDVYSYVSYSDGASRVSSPARRLTVLFEPQLSLVCPSICCHHHRHQQIPSDVCSLPL